MSQSPGTLNLERLNSYDTVCEPEPGQATVCSYSLYTTDEHFS